MTQAQLAQGTSPLLAVRDVSVVFGGIVALKLNDGTGPYAFNCGAPAFRFTEERLINDIGPRLLAMVRNIEAALGGAAAPQSKKLDSKKIRSGGKVARIVEGL